MTKEELEKEAKEYRLSLVAKLRPKLQEGCNCKELVDIEKAYLAGAEPREKRIEELEQQIEEMKCCGNCKYQVCDECGVFCDYKGMSGVSGDCDKWELEK